MSFQLSSRNSTILASYLVILKPPRFETEESEGEARLPSSATTEDATQDESSGTLASNTPRSPPLTHTGRALRPDFLYAYLRERIVSFCFLRETKKGRILTQD